LSRSSRDFFALDTRSLDARVGVVDALIVVVAISRASSIGAAGSAGFDGDLVAESVAAAGSGFDVECVGDSGAALSRLDTKSLLNDWISFGGGGAIVAEFRF
jgi:hypothetical protein